MNLQFTTLGYLHGVDEDHALIAGRGGATVVDAEHRFAIGGNRDAVVAGSCYVTALFGVFLQNRVVCRFVEMLI